MLSLYTVIAVARRKEGGEARRRRDDGSLCRQTRTTGQAGDFRRQIERGNDQMKDNGEERRGGMDTWVLGGNYGGRQLWTGAWQKAQTWIVHDIITVTSAIPVLIIVGLATRKPSTIVPDQHARTRFNP